MTNKVGPAEDAGQVSSIAIFFEKKSHTFDFSNGFMQEPLNIFRGPWFSGLISESFHCGPNIQKEVPSYYPAKEDSDLAPFWEI